MKLHSWRMETGVAGALLIALAVTPARAEPLIWGIGVEQFEYRLDDSGDDALAWDFDALIGTDELKVVWRSEAEYETSPDTFESLENQLRLQVPVTTFFDAVAGIRYESPEAYNRFSGVLGLHGLAKQWIEVDADLFLSKDPSARFEIEYEGLITNRVILTPSAELNVPFSDDEDAEARAWGPTVELGARLGYDLVDRLVSPYIGVHFEQKLGETKSLAEEEGRDDSAFFGVVGVKMLF